MIDLEGTQTYRRLRVKTRHTRRLVDGGIVRWDGPARNYEGHLTNYSAQGLTLQDVNATLRIPVEQVLEIEDV